MTFISLIYLPGTCFAAGMLIEDGGCRYTDENGKLRFHENCRIEMGIVGVAPCSPEQMQRPGEQFDFGARYIVHFSEKSSADVWAACDGSYVVNGTKAKGARVTRDGVEWLVIPIKGKELLEFEAISE